MKFINSHSSITALLVLMAATPLSSNAFASPGEGPIWVGRFDRGLAPWQEVRLSTKLQPNTFTVREWDGVAALEVQSSASMSLLARPVMVDLARTPVLCWRWRVDAPLKSADLTQRSGDDYAARLYVSLALPDAEKSLGLRTQLRIARSIWGASVPDAAINYVWDNRQPVGTERPNAYTDRTTMVVLRSGAADAGGWVQERRDVGRDIVRLYGASATPVQLAITADTDNTGETARAGFADLHWVTEQAACEKR
ncbi:DUF3047 domain-containing protein [Polaromonas sp. CG_9.11]|uniref:DUF3047 domain-containing protein n=1 Tax=Polaromonas sp. CG_9.11 TaxID=2787730 RepID=UPI001A255833|nr:DUF3047 domain-containing protein [Polaromonas sp. CG_9.11]MBG6076209.1 hypothetical protein [Polaromonas sp. CG_9.11]